MKSYNISDILSIVSYGTELRQAVENISKSSRGALLVLSETARTISEGGFNINSKFTAQKIVELAKMDGAIIISKDLKKILTANTLLIPDSRIKSDETGTKHKAADRTAKQLKVITIAASEKSPIVSLYYGNEKYTLSGLTELLYKAREIVENLERQRIEINNLLEKFNILELYGSVKLEDLGQILNKIILFFKDGEQASIYMAELGKHAETLKTRFGIVTSDLNKDLENIKKDYETFFKMQETIDKIQSLKTPTLDQAQKILLNNQLDEIDTTTNLRTKGYRILSKVDNLTDGELENLIREFGDIRKLQNKQEDELKKIDGITDKKAKAITQLFTHQIE